MKIAFDQQIFIWQEYGGISRYAYQLAAELATSCNQEVALVCPLHVTHYLAAHPNELKVFGTKAPSRFRSGRLFRAVNLVASWLIMRWFRPSIVHETYYSARKVAPPGAKVVLTVYDMIHERYPCDFPESDSTSHQKRLAVAQADHVICISKQTQKDLIEFFGVPPKKTSVVYLGFALTETLDHPMRVGEPESSYLLYVGNRSGYKNFGNLLQAYAASPLLLKNFNLVCFGGCPLAKVERDRIESLGIPLKNVRHMAGDDAALKDAYRKAAAFVYPSLYEGFGIPPLEAMSFGCPVICSNSSSIPEVVGDAGEMFDPNDAESMRSTLERVMADPSLREVMVGRGYERIKQFSWERCARETLNVYQQVCS